MPDSPSKPSLLEALRRQSEAAREHGAAERRPVEETAQDTDRRLWRAFKWLDEALGHLEVIHPTVAHRFAIPGVLSFSAPTFDPGFVSYRRRTLGGMEVLEHVEMFYRLTHAKPIVLRMQLASVLATEEKLRAAHLEYHYQTELDERRTARCGVFTVTPAVTASVRFAPDYWRRVVEVTLRNVDRFEPVILEFPAAAIDEGVLEELVRFMLGEANTFLHRAPLSGLGGRGTAELAAQQAARKATGT